MRSFERNCPSCGAVVSAGEPGSGGSKRCGACGALVFESASGPRVIIVHEVDDAATEIGVALLAGGYAPVRATTGAEALHLVRSQRPAALVLDVSLVQPSTFTVIDAVRADPATCDVKIILLTSVFRRSAYRRAPARLYGADDYVDAHEIRERLAIKIRRLLESETAAAGVGAPGVGEV